MSLNLLAATSAFHASLPRSMLTTYVGVIVFLVLYFIATGSLDRPGNATRIRLQSTVVRAKHVGALPHQQLARRYWNRPPSRFELAGFARPHMF